MALQRCLAAILLMFPFLVPVVECSRVKRHSSSSKTSGGHLVASQSWKHCGNPIPKLLQVPLAVAEAARDLYNGEGWQGMDYEYCHKSWRLVTVRKGDESWAAGPVGWSSYNPLLPKTSGSYGTIFGVFNNTLLIKEQDEYAGHKNMNVGFQSVTNGKKQDGMAGDPLLNSVMNVRFQSVTNAGHQFGVNGAELIVQLQGGYEDRTIEIYTMSNKPNDGGVFLSKLATLGPGGLEHMKVYPSHVATANAQHAYVFVGPRSALYQIPKVPPTSEVVLTPSVRYIKNFAVDYVFTKPTSTSTSLLIIGGPCEEKTVTTGDLYCRASELAVYEATFENFDAPKTWKRHISPCDEKVEDFSEKNLPEDFSWESKRRMETYVDGGLCVAYDDDNQHLYLGCGPITVLDLSPATWKVLAQMKLPVESGSKQSRQITSIAWVKN